MGDDENRFECDSCDWSIVSESKVSRLRSAIFHAIGASHSVSDRDLLAEYETAMTNHND